MSARFDQVFIVTYGRSGSTNLQNVLNSIDGYHVGGENGGALLQLFHSVHAVKASQDKIRPHRRKRQLPPTTEPNHPWFGIHDVDADAYADALVRSFVEHVIRPPHDARVYGFKEIRYAQASRVLPELLDFMRARFSNPAFVFNYRTWDDVAASRWWAKKDPEELRTMLGTFEETASGFAAAHPERCIELHYEDYAHHPANLSKLFAFLGEDFDEDRITRLTSERLRH